MTPAQHLLDWFTPERRKLINALAIDRYAQRPLGSFSRYLKKKKRTTFERAGVKDYYPVLRLIGYLPPPDVWVPTRPLTADETSTDLRKWFTQLRKDIISLRAVDLQCEAPLGVLGRYLNGEEHMTFKIVGVERYYPVLKLLGYEPPKEPEWRLNL